MGSLSTGQIVLANFPFSNLSKNKVRPCLIIGIAEFNDVILCQITSKSYSSKSAIPLTNKDFQNGSIAVSSFIRPDKIATVDKSMVTQILGSLKPAKINMIKRTLKKVLEIN